MAISLEHFLTRLGDALSQIGRHRVHRELLQCGDHTLANLGFSRELLKQGLDAWPWRVDDDDEAQEQRHRQPALYVVATPKRRVA